MKSVCNFLIFLVTTSSCLAQIDYDKLEFEHYTATKGLPDNCVRCIVQDKMGYIWLGTQNGLSRFNGYAFKNFEKNQNPIKLKSDRVIALRNFGDSSLGMITLHGAHSFNYYSYKSRLFQIEDSTAFSVYSNTVRGFEELDNNYTYLSRTGFYEFNSEGKIIFEDKYQFTGNTEISIRSPDGKLLPLDSENIIIYSAKNGTELYNSNKKQKTQLPSKLFSEGINAFSRFSNGKTIRQKISENEYLFIPLDKDTIYYLDIKKNIFRSSALPFSTAKELLIYIDKIYKLGANTFGLTSYHGGFFTFTLSSNKKIEVNSKRFLSAIRCNALLIDREERLWICAVNGLYKQKNINTPIGSLKISPEKSESELLSGLYIVGNTAFINKPNSDFLIVDIDKKEIKKKFKFYDGVPEWNDIGSIRSYHKDTLWLAATAGILWLDMNNFSYGKVPLPKALKDIPLCMGALNIDEKAWMCGYYKPPYVCYDVKKRTFTYYNDTTKIKPNFIKTLGLSCDKYGDVWFYGYGLSRWNNREQKFDTIIKDFGRQSEFKPFFHFVRADDYGSLWIGIQELGLLEYNTATKKITLYEAINSVGLDYIQTTSEIVDDKLWLCLTNKLVCFNVKTKQASVYSQVENLPHEQSMPNGFFYHKKNNEFYSVAGSDLIIRFKNEAPKYTKREILISELNYNETTSLYHPKDTIKLKYYQNSISVYFDVVDYNLKYPQKFKYSIDGDGVWRNVEQKQPVFMYNLNDGWHSVTIKFDYDDINNTTKVLYIFIEPPFWRKMWFYTLIALTILCGIYLITIQLLKRARKKNDINLQLKEFEFKALHAQMNPHFIFNSLNSIKALILYDKNVEASQYLNKFSNLVRQNLDHSRRQFLTLTQNIEYISQYIEIEAIRFKDLNYEIVVSEELDANEIKIAPMLLQPIIENAIWHGLQSVKGYKRLTIRFKTEASRVICEIEDNGIGINKTVTEIKKNHTSIGIENIRQRIQLLNEKYSINYILEIKDKSEINNSETGTLVTLSFNYF